MNKQRFIKIIKDNGFDRVESNSYANCLGINITIVDDGILVVNKMGDLLFASELGYYSVIGYLFCENLIHEEFKLIRK